MKINFWESIESITQFVGIIAATGVLAYFVDRFFAGRIQKASSNIHNDPTNYKFLRHTVTALIYILGFSWAIYEVPSLRALANSLLAGAGILAVAVGFASQQALSNIISGIFLIMFKPFRVNDRLKIRESSLVGIVEDITLRHTVIRDFENRRIIIPNAVIGQEVLINSDFGDGKIIRWVEVSVSYSADIKKAKAIMREEVLKHPLHTDPRTPEEIAEGKDIVPVRVISLGEYSITIRAWACAHDASQAFEMGCDLLETIKQRFDEEGIEIPYPYTNVVIKADKNKSTEITINRL